MTQAIIATLFVVFSTITIWSLATLLRSNLDSVPPKEVTATDQKFLDQLDVEDANGVYTIGVAEITRVQILPFPKFLPGFHLNPHKIIAATGLLGAILLCSSFLWCMFAPRTLSARSAWSVPGDSQAGSPPSVVIHREDGSIDRIDMSGNITNKTESDSNKSGETE